MSGPSNTITNKRLNEVTNRLDVGFAFDPSHVYIPKRFFYKDYLCLEPNIFIDLSGWQVSSVLFEFLRNELMLTTKKLWLDNAQGITENDILSLREFPKLIVLSLRNTIPITLNIAKTVIGSIKTLRELDISENEVNLSVFKSLGLTCHYLHTLKCSACKGLDDFCLQSIGEMMKRWRVLKHLDFSRSLYFSDEGMLTFLQSAQHLIHSLTISECKSISTLTFSGLRQIFPELTYLDLSRNNYGQTSFEFISEGCRMVKTLNVSQCPEFDDTGMIAIGRKMKHLTHLNMKDCSKVTDHGTVGFFQAFRGNLQYLNITNCSLIGEAGALAISTKSESLIDFRMNGLSKVTSKALLSLWKSCKSLTRFEMASDLKVVVTHRRSMIPHMTDDILAQVGCNELQVLKLSGSVLVTDAGMAAICRICNQLSYVDLSYCGLISNDFLHAAAKILPNLKVVIVSGCHKVTDVGLITLSEGVPGLKRLEFGGCSKISDTGVFACAKLIDLETIVTRSCDLISNEGIIAIAENCKNLKSVDISGLDLVNEDAISVLVKNCLELVKLNCDGCAIGASSFARIVKPVLPLARPTPATCKLQKRDRHVYEYNKYALQLHYHHIAARKMQRLAIVIHKWAWIKMIRNARNKMANDIQRTYRGHVGRIRFKRIWDARAKFYGDVSQLQKAMRMLIGIYYAKLKAALLRREAQARGRIQRYYRGHMVRKRYISKMVRAEIATNKFGYIAYKYWIIRSARLLHLRIIKAQSVVRMRPRYIRHQAMKPAIVKIQKFVRVFLKELRQRRALEEAIAHINEGRVTAVLNLQKWYRALAFNWMIAPFIKRCGEYYRDIYEMELYYSQVIQRSYRGYKGRMRAKYLRERPGVLFRAATKIQAMYLCHYHYVHYKHHMALVVIARRKWREFLTISSRAKLGFAKMVGPIQRTWRLHMFREQRQVAAISIQKLARWFLKQLYLYKQYLKMMDDKAITITHAYWRYKARLYRKELMAIEHIAAFRIQRRARKNLDGEARKRIRSKTASRKYNENLIEKKRLQYDSRIKLIDRIASRYRNQCATNIQRAYRSYRKEKMKKKQAEINRLKSLKDAHQELTKQMRSKALRFLPDPVRIAKRIARTARNLMKNPNQIISEAERPRLVNGILTHQTLSLVQEGVLEIAMTMGRGQFESFNQEQEFNKNSNQGFFKQVGDDLTGKSELSMFLWAKYGTGKECICKLSIHARPSGLSAIARQERRTSLYNRGIKLCDHDQIAFELHGECSVKIGKGGFAVNGVLVAQSTEEAEAAKARGYHLVGDLMRFNIPTSIWECRREAYKDPDMYKLGALPKMEWMDPRLKRCIEAFNLTEEDVHIIRHSFETALGEYISETITYSDILKYLDYPENECVKWVFGAVEPRRADQLTFSEYVHVICYYCMFGRSEMIRFIFGNMDTEKKYFLRKDEFRNLLEILSADTMRNPKQLILSWNRFMSPSLKAIFLPGFDAFAHENPGVLWLFQLLQDKLKAKHMGEVYWDNKVKQFMQAREDLGVILI